MQTLKAEVVGALLGAFLMFALGIVTLSIVGVL